MNKLNVKFVDLFCGSGKAVIAASLLYHFSECIGFEPLEGLYDIALKVREKYISLVKSRNLSSACQKVTFRYSPLKDTDISNADIVYCTTGTKNANYEKVLLEKFRIIFNFILLFIFFNIETMKYEAYAILVSKNILAGKSEWHLLEKMNTVMEWGDATVFILRKVQIPDVFSNL